MYKVMLILCAIVCNLVMAHAALCDSSAANVAMKHAGVEKIGPCALFVAPEEEDGRLVYEVKFHDDKYVYEYKVDSETGRVLKSERKALLVVKDQEQGGDIGGQKARALALADANATDKATRIKVDREYDDGSFVYEVEFIVDGVEHDYTIDAQTGQILKHEEEKRD